MLPETLSLVKKAIEESQLPASDCPMLVDGSKNNEKALNNWLQAHQKITAQNPAKDTLARKIAFYMVQAPDMDGLVEAAFALLYPHSSVRMLHSIHPQQFIEGDYTLSGTLGEIAVMHEVSPVFPSITSVEQIAPAIAALEVWAKTVKEPHDKTNPLFIAQYAEYLSVQHFLKAVRARVPLTRENIPALIQSLDYRASKTGFTGNPRSPYNIFCAQLAWLCVDASKGNVQEQFWKILYPEATQVFDGNENKTWPRYGEALLDDHCLIHYRGVYEQIKTKSPEAILNQRSASAQVRIKSFVSAHATIWNGLDQALLQFSSARTQPLTSLSKAKNYLDFFNQVHQLLDHYKKGSAAQSGEYDIGENGAFEMIPYQARMVEFKKFVLLKPPNSPLKIFCMQQHTYTFLGEALKASLLDIISNLTETKTDRMKNNSKSCFQRNQKALESVLKDPSLREELKNIRFIFDQHVDSNEERKSFEGIDALHYAKTHLQVVNFRQKSEGELQRYASQAFVQGYDMVEIVKSYQAILKQQGSAYRTLNDRIERGITERVHNFVFNMSGDTLDAQQDFLRNFFGDGTWILLCNLEQFDKDVLKFLNKICENYHMSDEAPGFIIAALNIIDKQSLSISPEYLPHWVDSLNPSEQEKNNELILRILTKKCMVNGTVNQNFFIFGVPKKYYPALIKRCNMSDTESIKLIKVLDLKKHNEVLKLFPLPLRIDVIKARVKDGTETKESLTDQLIEYFPNEAVDEAVRASYQDLLKGILNNYADYLWIYQSFVKHKPHAEKQYNPLLYKAIRARLLESTSVAQIIPWMQCEDVTIHKIIYEHLLQWADQKKHFTSTAHFIELLKQLNNPQWHLSLIGLWLSLHPKTTREEFNAITPYLRDEQQLIKAGQIFGCDVTVLLVRNMVQLCAALKKVSAVYHDTDDDKTKRIALLKHGMMYFLHITAHYLEIIKYLDITEQHSLIAHWLKRKPFAGLAEFNEMLSYIENKQQIKEAYHAFGEQILESISSPLELCKFLCYASVNDIQACLDRSVQHPKLKNFMLHFALDHVNHSIGYDDVKQILGRYIEQHPEKFFPAETMSKDLAAFKLQRSKLVMPRQTLPCENHTSSPVALENANQKYRAMMKIIKSKTITTEKEPQAVKKEAIESTLGKEIIDQFCPDVHQDLGAYDVSKQYEALERLSQFVHARFFTQLQTILAAMQEQIDQSENEAQTQQFKVVSSQFKDAIKHTLAQIVKDPAIVLMTRQQELQGLLLAITSCFAQSPSIAEYENTIMGYLKFICRQLLALVTDSPEKSNPYHNENFPSYRTYTTVNSHIHTKCRIKEDTEMLPIAAVTMVM
jgi:hypothetical protein